MADYIHTQSGARVSVADGKVLGIDFEPVGGQKAAERSAMPDKSWKVVELKAYADEHGIDLGDATKKDDILAVLEGAPDDAQDSDPGGGPESDEPDGE